LYWYTERQQLAAEKKENQMNSTNNETRMTKYGNK
jgi:hypothetical protein